MERNKNKLIMNIFIFIAMLTLCITPALALDEIQYSPFTEAGGWGATSGKERAFDYNDILYVANGQEIHSYNMETWEYLDQYDFDSDINDLKYIDGILYLTQNESIKTYNVSNNLSLIQTYDYSLSITQPITSFDVMSDSSNLAYTSNEGTIEIRDIDDNSLTRSITATVDIVRFSYDDEVVFGVDIGAYQGGITGYAVSNGASLFSDSVASNYLRYFNVHPSEDRYLMGWSYGFSDYDVYEVNYTSNSAVDIRSWTGYKLPHKASYSEDGTLLMRMRAVDGEGNVYLHLVSDGSQVGTWDPTGTNEYPTWTYIPQGNTYAIVGTTTQLYVLNTGVAAPLITTSDVDNDGTTSIYSGAINDIGDAYEANCTIEYKSSSLETWTEGTYTEYTNESDFPNTFTFTTFSTVEGNEYDYRAKCIYAITGVGTNTIYGLEKSFTAVKAPFNVFQAVVDNMGIVVGLFLTIVMIAVLAGYGITNPIVLGLLTIIASFVMTAIGVYSLTTTIFITIFCIVIALFINLVGGRE